MTDGERLLVACVKHNNSRVFSQIQKSWLDDDEYAPYKFLQSYYREHSEFPGVKTFCSKFKFDITEVDSRPAYFLSRVKDRYIYTVLSDKIPSILKDVKKDPMSGLSSIQDVVASLSDLTVTSKDTKYSDDLDERLARYEERTRSLGVTYLSMGVEVLDAIFYGYQKTDLITIGGRAGQGKTWLLLFLTYLLDGVLSEYEDAHSESIGDILFFTNEMSKEEIDERLDCISFKLPYTEYLGGKLSKRAMNRFSKGLEDLKRKGSKIRIIENCWTLDMMEVYVSIYKPAAIFVDGSYLMEPKMKEGWEKIVYITRNLKRITKNQKVPLINTTQLRKGSGKSGDKDSLDSQDEFAYSGSYVQDSDIAFTMYQDADMKFHDLVGCKVAKGRRVPAGTTMYFQNNLSTMSQSITVSEETKKDAGITTEDKPIPKKASYDEWDED